MGYLKIVFCLDNILLENDMMLFSPNSDSYLAWISNVSGAELLGKLITQR